MEARRHPVRWCFDKERLLEFALDHMPGVRGFGDCEAIGLEIDGRIVCAVIYNEFRKHDLDIRMHVAAVHPMWCRPEYLAGFFDYPFNQLGCVRVTGVVRVDNERAIRVNRKLGFVEEGRPRRVFNGEVDAVLFGMLREECQWINEKEV